MAPNQLKNLPKTALSSATKAFLITPSDTQDLPDEIRGILVGGTAGVIVYDGWDGTTNTTGPVPVGCTLLVEARRVRATGTTATGLTGLV